MGRTDRLFHLLDRVLATAFAAALVCAVLAALPRTAHAAEQVTAAGPVTAEQRVLGDFEAIAVSGGINLKIRQGTQAAADVRAEANLLPLLETVVEGKTLHVRWKRGSHLRIRQSPTVEVTVVQLQSVATAGSSDVTIAPLKTPQLAISISGAGDVHVESLASDELSVKIAGSGNLKASGQAARVQIKVSGSGDVQTEALKADDVSVSIAGSGDAAVHAAKSLAVSIAGSGDVVYRGDPQVKSSIAGSGTVRKH